MEQALYRKYRSRSFDEVVGQDHITKTLRQSIESGRISHAYLFTGPRGVGKTSVARILAREVNNLLFDGEMMHLDIIEIDAASNRRIDEIRDLREKVRIAPVSGKYKVYIIDEVHMLTRESFNALLKTLEEPPAHSIFILATTESHKLPETIISRTQRFEFKPITTSDAVKHLEDIAKKENIQISIESLKLLSEFGNGSFRDSISYLDQLSSASKKITDDDVREVLGIPSERMIEELIKLIKQGDTVGLLKSLQTIKDLGVDASKLSSSISKNIRAQIMINGASSFETTLLKQLLDVPSSSRPDDFLEITLLEACQLNSKSDKRLVDQTKLLAQSAARSKKHTAAAIVVSTPPTTRKVAEKKTITRPSNNDWPEILNRVKEEAASIYTALRLSKPAFTADTATITFQFPLHQKKLEQSRNKAVVSSIIEEVTGKKMQIDCVVDKSAFSDDSKPHREDISTDSNSKVESIHSIFGAAEVIGS
ncbi:MAG TPA: DNA polymerase III subunit gamma/tau [Candidatus Babeliales bacterium]|nr:DNA polymerase III subunit gamma/tau [Candidatus Babeliales bacterium]